MNIKTWASMALLSLLQACAGGDAGTTHQTAQDTQPRPLTPTGQTGVARYQGQSTCTAFLLDLQNDGAPAYALTNGHCAQRFGDPDTPYAVIRNQPSADRLVFFYADSSQAAQLRVPVAEIVYSSLNGTDLAVLRLDSTVGQLRAKGVHPIPIQHTPLPAGSAIEVIGAPQGGFLQQVSCRQGPRVDVTEFVWVWSQLQSNDCTQVYPGMSGSPVFDPVSRHAVGVINTTTVGMSGSLNCVLGSPCEIRPEGTRPVAQTSYAVPIDQLPACFANGVWSPQAGSCPLQLASGPALLPKALYSPLQHKAPSRRWQFEGSYGPDTQITFVTARQGACEQAAGYQPYQPDNLPWLPTQEGVHLACVRDGDRLTVHPIEVDNTPPTLAPIVRTYPLNDGSLSVELQYRPPEISDYVLATSDTEAGCRARSEADFRPYFRVPVILQAPIHLCLKTRDRAENESPVWIQWIP